MKSSYDTSKVIKKIAQELAKQQRQALAQIAGHLADQQKTDVSAIEDLPASQLPDVDKIARQVIAIATLEAIVHEAMIRPLVRNALSTVVDDCVRKTLTQTDFAEALIDNLQHSIERSDLAAALNKQIQEPAIRDDFESVASKHLNEIIVEGDFVDLIEERVNALMAPSLLGQQLHRHLDDLVAKTDFSKLLSERLQAVFSELDHPPTFNQQNQDVAVEADLVACLSVDGSTANAHIKQLAEALCSAIRIESFRLIPYDQFIDRTFGSLPDFTLERDQPDYVEVSEELE